MRCLNNAHKIGQVNTKMNEEFQDENKRKTSIKYLSEQELDETEEIESNNSNSGEESSDEANVIDHMYHSSDTNIIGVEATLSQSHTFKEDLTSSPVTSGGCQTLESEVKFIKEWLILHTDLIQQQNDDILDKDREIYLLRKENEMLRERILCIEKGIARPFTAPSCTVAQAVVVIEHHC
nr:unnamed protein product [Callosobruchus analis]